MAALDVGERAPEDWREDWVSFRGIAAGDEQIADAYHAAGTLDDWVRAVEIRWNSEPRPKRSRSAA